MSKKMRKKLIKKLTEKINMEIGNVMEALENDAITLEEKEHQNSRLAKLVQRKNELETGVFTGQCVMCDEPITTNRLLANPWTNHCVQCQKIAEQHDPTIRHKTVAWSHY